MRPGPRAFRMATIDPISISGNTARRIRRAVRAAVPGSELPISRIGSLPNAGIGRDQSALYG